MENKWDHIDRTAPIILTKTQQLSTPRLTLKLSAQPFERTDSLTKPWKRNHNGTALLRQGLLPPLRLILYVQPEIYFLLSSSIKRMEALTKPNALKPKGPHCLGGNNFLHQGSKLSSCQQTLHPKVAFTTHPLIQRMFFA